MKKFAILLFICLSVDSFPQGRNDSLLSLAESAHDTVRIRVLKELCWEFRFIDPAEALKFGLEALTLANQQENSKHKASINNYLGVIQRNTGDHAQALEFFNNAKRIAEATNNVADRAYALNNIGDIYNMEGKYQEAMEFELTALKAFEDIGDSIGISYCSHQLALVCTNLGDYSSALEYDKRAMDIRESLGNMAGVAYSLKSIGETYRKLGEYQESLACLEESSEIFTQLGDSIGLALSLHSIGIYYRLTGDTDKAIPYLVKALRLGEETNSPLRIRNTAELLSRIYAEQNRFEDAYRMHILFKETYDSLYHEENLVKLTQLILQNEYEQKALVQQAEIERQKQFRNYLILSFGLVIILVIVLLNRNNIKRKANINLQLKNKEIESQKETLEKLFVSLRIKNDELSQQNEEIAAQKEHLVLLNNQLEQQKSELNNAIQELRQAQSHLVQSEKMASLGQVTAGVAHELNNPLNFVSASIKPLQRNVDDLLSILHKYDDIINRNDLSSGFEEVAELKNELDFNYLVDETKNLLKGVLEGASRSEHIVKDLRTFSRMDENEFKGVNIHDGIDSTLLLLHHKMQDKISIHKTYGKIQHVECLPGKLNQVFMNILSNSILAIEDKGDIYIETSSLNGMARISIRDSGKGMTPEIREHIFEPFYTTREVGKGTGLGLSISYSIIEEHRGTIEVLSEPGVGSEFIIMLPFRKAD